MYSLAVVFLLIVFLSLAQLFQGLFFQRFKKNDNTIFLNSITGLVIFYISLLFITNNVDWEGYELMFEDLIVSQDLLFRVISDCFQKIGYNYTEVYRLHILLIGIFFLLFVSKFTEDRLFVLVSILIVLFVPLSNQIRYYLAFALFLGYSYYLIIKKRWFISIVFAILSILSHKGIILLLFFPLIFYFTKPDELIRRLTIYSVALFILTLLILKIELGLLIDHYRDYFMEGHISSIKGGIFSAIPSFLFIVFVIVLHNSLKRDFPDLMQDRKYKFLYYLSVYSIIFIPVGFILQIISHRYNDTLIIVRLSYVLYSFNYIKKTQQIPNRLIAIESLLFVNYLFLYIVPSLINLTPKRLIDTIDQINSNSLLLGW